MIEDKNKPNPQYVSPTYIEEAFITTIDRAIELLKSKNNVVEFYITSDQHGYVSGFIKYKNPPTKFNMMWNGEIQIVPNYNVLTDPLKDIKQ
jgi:hypothetical protein